MNRRVLLIDADPAFRDTLTHQLDRYRVVVMTEPDAERALAIGAADVPSLIVISVEEPEKAGFRVFQKCKKGALGKVPIMLVTATVTTESFAKHRGLKTHADEYIDKRTMTADELVGKIDNLIGLGDLEEDELGMAVEDEIPMEIGDGDVVLDETVGEEFQSDAKTVGPRDGMRVDSVVGAETDAAFDALLGGDPEPRAASTPAPMPMPIEDHAAIPEPVPHVLDEIEPVEAVPAQIHDGGRDAPDESPSQIGAPVFTDFDHEDQVAQVSAPLIEAPSSYESSPAIQLDDAELEPLDDELAVEVEAAARPIRAQSEPVITSAPRPATLPFPMGEAPTVMRAPIHHESPTVAREPIITDEAREPRPPGSGSHPAIDLGLDRVAHDAESEQSGIYDRRALRKIGELERQIAQLKAEVERTRSATDVAAKGAGREREFLNLREAMLAKDKELQLAKDDVAARDRELVESREKLRVAQHTKTALEAKNGELEQRLFDDAGQAKGLAGSLEAAFKKAEAAEHELAAAAQRIAGLEAAHAELEAELAAERARGAATASEAEAALRAEREVLVQRHQAALAALRAEAAAAHDGAIAHLREELETAHAAAMSESIEEVRRANAAEHERIVDELERTHAGDMVALKTDQVGELTQVRQELGGELARVKAALAEATTAHADALAAAADHQAAQLEALAAKHAAELTSLEDEHAEARERDAESHGQALAQMKSQLDRMAAGHEVKLDAAQRQLDALVVQHEEAHGALHDQHQAALAAAIAKHEQELAKLHDDRAQLADAARRTAEAHRATLAETQQKFDAELAEIHEAAARELAEHKGTLLAARRAAEDATARHAAATEAAQAAHAQAIADLAAKHERAMSVANGEFLKTKAVADADHARVLAAHEAEAEAAHAALVADHARVVRDLTAEKDELRRGLSSARDSLKRSEGELASAVQTIADRNGELRTHAAAIAERDQRLAELRKEIEALEHENASYQDQVLRAYQKIKADEAMVSRARKAMAIALTVLDDQGNPTSS